MAVTVRSGEPFHTAPEEGVTVTGKLKFVLEVMPLGAVTVIDWLLSEPPVNVNPDGSAFHT
jgi:hypothetical protein